MRRVIIFATALCLAASSFAGFKAKSIKQKRPEKFQTRLAAFGVTVASDLLITEKEQAGFFFRPLNPCNIIALRLAIFNDSKNEVLIPLEGLQLVGPDGKALERIGPEEVAEAVLQGFSMPSQDGQPSAEVAANPRVLDIPRDDPSNPRYDPPYDPSDPQYDPGYDPSDPRTGQNRRYGRIEPGINVDLNPSGASGASSDIMRRFISKDFVDKAYLPDPVLPSMKRDRFLFFSITERPASIKGFELRIPATRSFPDGLTLRY